MANAPRVLLLIGSAREPHSTSESLGKYLVEQLRARGMLSEIVFLDHSTATAEQQEVLMALCNWADIVVLTFPLYLDAPPYLVVKTLELIAAHRRNRLQFKHQRLLCLVHCGFPEAAQNDTAIAICRRFARQAEFDWMGGLALGGGELIDGQPLPQLGRKVRHLTHALDLTADALANEQPIPQQAFALFARLLISVGDFLRSGEREWKRRAKKLGTEDTLNDRPFA